MTVNICNFLNGKQTNPAPSFAARLVVLFSGGGADANVF